MLFQLSFCHVATLLLPIKKCVNNAEFRYCLEMNPIFVSTFIREKAGIHNSRNIYLFTFSFIRYYMSCNISSWKNQIMRKFDHNRNQSANYNFLSSTLFKTLKVFCAGGLTASSLLNDNVIIISNSSYVLQTHSTINITIY